MRAAIMMAAAAMWLSACGPEPEAPAPEAAPAVAEEAAPARPAPLTLERTAACAAALDTFKGFGKGAPPAGMSIEDFGAAALITLRAVEVQTTDAPAYQAAYASAKTLWADQTPGDIEAALSACIAEVKG